MVARLLLAAAVSPTEAPSGCYGYIHSTVHKVRSAAPHAVSDTNPSSHSFHMTDEQDHNIARHNCSMHIFIHVRNARIAGLRMGRQIKLEKNKMNSGSGKCSITLFLRSIHKLHHMLRGTEGVVEV